MPVSHHSPHLLPPWRSLVRAGVPSSLRWSLWTSHLRAAPRGSAQWPAEGTTPCAPPLEVAADAARTSLGGKRLVEEEVKSLEKAGMGEIRDALERQEML